MMDNKYKLFLKINLSFFDSGEKTEQPTAKKKSKAREEGNVAMSQEVGTALLFIVSFWSLKTFGGAIGTNLMKIIVHNLTLVSEINDIFSISYMSAYVSYMFAQTLLIVLPIFAVILVAGVVSNLAQVGWHPTTKTLKPKFSKLNPLNGFKRLFSFKTIIELIKSIVVLLVIGFAIYNLLKKEINIIPKFIEMDLSESVAYIGDLCTRLGINVGIYYLIIAAADLFYTRFKHTKDLKMTKYEVKEEYKQSEGDPHIKGKIKQKMREISMRRMMQGVTSADVIITNPTHFAVALKYDKEESLAPTVVAKGVDHLARRIKKAAAENHIEIVENVQLARTLYSTVDIGKEIPPELYQTVAEVLAYVYKLKNKVS